MAALRWTSAPERKLCAVRELAPAFDHRLGLNEPLPLEGIQEEGLY